MWSITVTSKVRFHFHSIAAGLVIVADIAAGERGALHGGRATIGEVVREPHDLPPVVLQPRAQVNEVLGSDRLLVIGSQVLRGVGPSCVWKPELGRCGNEWPPRCKNRRLFCIDRKRPLQARDQYISWTCIKGILEILIHIGGLQKQICCD
jgi:hypothetical protein